MDKENNNDQPNTNSRPVRVFDQSQLPQAAISPQASDQIKPLSSSQQSIPPSSQSAPQKKFFGMPALFTKIKPKIALIAFAVIIFLIGSSVLVKTILLKPKTPEIVKLTYWGLWEDTDSIQSLISDYESHNSNVKITYVKQSQEDYRERLINALKTGKAPDIFRFHNTWGSTMATSFSVLPQDIMDTSTFKSTFYPVMVKDLQSGGSFIGMPLMYDGLGLYINEALFSQAQKNPPTTWDELRQTATDLTIKDQGKIIQQAGVALGRTDNVDNWEDILSLLMVQNKVDLKNPSGDNALGALKFYTSFATESENPVWDSSLPKSTQAFASGKVAMYFGSSSQAFEIKQLNPNLAFRVVPVPQLPKNTTSDPDINWASYWVEGVWSKSKNQKEAWKFLKFLSEKNSQQKLYANASKARLFGPIYSRVDMAESLVSDPFMGAYVKEAPTAQSGYLSSKTFDGNNGINTQLSKIYELGIDSILNNRKDPKEIMQTISQEVQQILRRVK